MAEEVEMDLITLKEEYQRLQDSLHKIELKYQTALETQTKKDGNDDVVANFELMKFVSGLFNNADYSDIELILEGNLRLYGHKLVLAARNSSWGLEDFVKAESLDLSDFSYDVIYSIIRWVYTNEISLQDMEDVFIIELLKASINYGLKTLSNMCQEELIHMIDEDNFEKIYELTQHIPVVEIHQYCKSFQDKQLEKASTQLQEEYIELKAEDILNQDEEDEDANKVVIDGEVQTSGDVFSCVVCGIVFDSIHDMSLHILEHQNSSNSKIASNKKLYKRVIKDPKTCQLCLDVVPGGREFNSHMKKYHNLIKCNVCKHCGKSYKKPYYLRVHMRVHSGERPYSCDICGRTFIEAGVMRLHKKYHEQERPFVCDVCGHGCVTKGALNQHKRIHNKDLIYDRIHNRKFMCSICGKKFSQKGHMKAHELTHSGAKPFSCDVCDKKFADASSCKRHYKIHSGERPHVCHVCGRGFIQRVQLVKHVRTHEKHGDIPPGQGLK